MRGPGSSGAASGFGAVRRPRGGARALVEHVRHSRVAERFGELLALRLGEAELAEVDRPDGADEQQVEQPREQVLLLQRNRPLQEGHLHRHPLLDQPLQQVAHLHWVLLVVEDLVDVEDGRARGQERLHLVCAALGHAMVADGSAPRAAGGGQPLLWTHLLEAGHLGEPAKQPVRRVLRRRERVLLIGGS
eukprot:1385694-Prymnesium_polylepis.1